MGTQYQYKCTSCQYSEVVSGGDDVGMAMVRTTTIICRNCARLYDVAISDPTEGFDIVKEPVCPKRKTHKIEKWADSHPCPKCGASMEQTMDVVVDWD